VLWSAQPFWRRRWSKPTIEIRSKNADIVALSQRGNMLYMIKRIIQSGWTIDRQELAVQIQPYDSAAPIDFAHLVVADMALIRSHESASVGMRCHDWSSRCANEIIERSIRKMTCIMQYAKRIECCNHIATS
jgi:hypothetical protein